MAKTAAMAMLIGLVLMAPAEAQDELGDAAESLKRAEETANQALALADEAGYVPGKVMALGLLAHAAMEARDWADAEKRQKEFAAAARDAKLPWQRLAAATLKGQIAEAKGDRIAAIKAYRDAVGEVEGLREGVRAEALQISFLRSKYEPYDRLITLLAAMEEEGEDLPSLMRMTAPSPAAMSLWYSEHVKARSLLDQLAGVASGWRHVPEAEREKVKPLEETAAERRQELTRAQLAEEKDDAEIRARRKALSEALKKLERAREKAILASPRAAFAAGKSELPTARELINICQRRDAVGIVYHVGEQAAVGYVVDPRKGEVRSFGLPWDAEVLGRQVSVARKGLWQTARGEAPDLSALSDGLLKEALEGIEPERLLCIVPDKELWGVPFAALPVDGTLLIERHPLFVTPSLSLLGTMEQQAKADRTEVKGLLAVGRPQVEGSEYSDLPATEQEVQAISGAYPGATVLLGEAAQESEVKRTLGQYELLHFAMHGKLDIAFPQNSGLVLTQGEPAEDGYLTAQEIADLDVRARLVTLSACDTGKGDYIAGEGLIGLTRAWLVAGADGVCASLWQVEDEATAELMAAFYRGLGEGTNAVQALRAAQRELAGKDATKHPYFWAGFEVVGSAG